MFENEINQLAEFPKPKVSFEFFPPKTQELTENLWLTIKDLESLNPTFVSITYGAGGSTRERTHEIISKTIQGTKLKPAAHLTCVGATKENIDTIVKNYWEIGLRHIVALRGDSPDKTKKYEPYPGGYAFADGLVKGIKAIGNFEISVAAYPETHPEAISEKDDIDHLKRKIDAGADRAITQYFFEADTYFRFLEKVRKAGVDAPIIPGIINISNYEQIVRFSKMCKSTIPQWMHEMLAPLSGNEEAIKDASIRISAKLCHDLMTRKLCNLINIK